ncbi:MBL fold metallo-hydrolase [Brachybacterium vulturis]|uniref:MBL fold metallo-hydrolase n=1 Tax=Brachybacterium vulturis TaxID=2017484 RepID=UPI0037364327
MDEHAPQRAPGGPAVELIAVRAENPGPMTLSGTNSYVLRDGDQVWVVDPGPRDPEHLAELLLQCGAESRPQGVLVTHRHLDHTAGAATLARQLAARSGDEVPLWAADQSAVPGSRPLPATLAGDHGTVGHLIHLPGHTSDSIAVLVDGGRLLSGDTLLGGSSTVIVPDDGGSLADYLQSLAILRAMTVDGRIGSIHPGHGPALETPLDALEAIEQAIAHRRERIEEVRRARTAGVLTMDRLLRVVYGPDLPEQLEGAARWNLRATLAHLAEER